MFMPHFHLCHGFSLSVSIVSVLAQSLVHFSQVPTGVLRDKKADSMNNPLGNYTTLLKSLHQPHKNIQGQSIEANYLQSVCQYVKFVGYVCCSILVSAPISSAPVTGSPVGSPPPGPVV